jgi:HD superfamily phosphodiesterase
MHYTIKRKVMKMVEGREPAHEFQHIMRAHKNANQIGQLEGANMEIVF